jgi:hypothetical protein
MNFITQPWVEPGYSTVILDSFDKVKADTLQVLQGLIPHTSSPVWVSEKKPGDRHGGKILNAHGRFIICDCLVGHLGLFDLKPTRKMGEIRLYGV